VTYELNPLNFTMRQTKILLDALDDYKKLNGQLQFDPTFQRAYQKLAHQLEPISPGNPRKRRRKNSSL
jgi:hypothetical protein